MNSLALKVQEGLKRDLHPGDLYMFRGKRCHVIRVLWHDGTGTSLYTKRLEGTVGNLVNKCSRLPYKHFNTPPPLR
jgi:IS66 Orf2 like protein